MSGHDSRPVGPGGMLFSSSKLAKKSLWFRKKPSTALSNTTTLTCSSASMAAMMSRNSRTNCGPITLSGGLSNVMRQYAADDRVRLICAVLVVVIMEASCCDGCTHAASTMRTGRATALALVGVVSRIVAGVYVLDAEWSDGGHLCHVFARFRPVE